MLILALAQVLLKQHRGSAELGQNRENYGRLGQKRESGKEHPKHNNLSSETENTGYPVLVMEPIRG